MADVKLHKFEGKEVIATKVAIVGAGDGLSKALAIDPEERGIGETVHVVMECVVRSVKYDEVKDTDSLVRTHTLSAVTVALADKELVGELLAAQQAKIDEAAGKARLDFLAAQEKKEDGEGTD